MKLSELIHGVPVENRREGDPEITGLTCDTRNLKPGGLFAALEGTRENGEGYIPLALDMGAAAVLCRRPPSVPGPWLIAEDPRTAYGLLCRNWFEDPGRDMTLIAVTGTNGKTTTTYLLREVLERVLGGKTGLIGTNGNLVGGERLPARRTTPDAYELYGLLRRMREAGCGQVVMETSSHALAQRRTAGLSFAVGIFTNLTRDHLDYHGTMEAYQRAKSLLFRQCETGVFNLDDGAGRRFTALCPAVTYALRRPADVMAEGIFLGPDHVRFTARTRGGKWPVRAPIPGRFTVYNCLAVLACCRALGLPLGEAAEALSHASGIRGRAEAVPVPAPFTVIIDYAHTPDALEKILTALRDGVRGRLVCLFGCGGDRDQSKRPVMGEIAAELADQVILTSDNPRSEDPETILDQIEAGFPPGFSDYVRQSDRRKAIRFALGQGRAGDVILLAGKGHEDTQEIGGRRIHLDEREEIASFFASNAL